MFLNNEVLYICMAGTFSRSWEITKLSFGVIGKDKEMLAFPILSGIFSLLFIVAILFPTIIVGMLAGNEFQGGIFELLILFVVYLGLAFIATFFNVATVYTAKKRFEGGNATFFESISFAFSKLWIIFLWALVSAIVGILLRLIEMAAERAGKVGEIVLTVVRLGLGAAWSIVTVFVIPILVYKGHTPFDAIKESTKTIKKTWGESLIRAFGLGLVELLLIVLGVVLTILGVFLVASLGVSAILFVIGLGIFFVLSVIIVFGVANNIYNTALYVYAETGKIPEGFNKEVLAHAFEENK